MRYTFVHLSDLHFRPHWHEECSLVCTKFFDDLELHIKAYENPYLLFSGDLVLAAGDKEQYGAFYSEFSNRLDALGLPHARRICVPGNHDVSQDEVRSVQTLQLGLLSQIRDETHFNNELLAHEKTIFSGKFRPYTEAEMKFAQYSCCSNTIGGHGWELDGGLGIYCLNTALCSFGGVKDSEGRSISDKGRLMIDTRSLNQWLANSKVNGRVLVMHHPLDWLNEWSRAELEKIIADEFLTVFCGHVHEQDVMFSSHGAGGCVQCIAPPLFTRKSNPLGYGFVIVDRDAQTVEVAYRQWTPKRTFVKGTSLANDDSGRVGFSTRQARFVFTEVLPPLPRTAETLPVLEREFEKASTCYSSKERLWVDRDLADRAETDPNRDAAVMSTPFDVVSDLRDCVIRAPRQFGLTCLGSFIALEYYRKFGPNKVALMLDAATISAHRQGVLQSISARCDELNIKAGAIAGFILDNCHGDKASRKIVGVIRLEFPNVPILILQGVDDCVQIANAITVEGTETFEPLYLWALTRSRIRELVTRYIDGMDLDEVLVTKKVIEDIDSLNIHRSPLNCLLMLKLAEQAFDESPVNRTEVIGRVLTLLFVQFDKIPKYSTRPDLKDCEYALGYFCEELMRSGNPSFKKEDFYSTAYKYCKKQFLDLDIDVLFAFLVMENIFVQRGIVFEFRFSYWLHFFAAHRMHHDVQFAQFILEEKRYSAYPEVLEFYAGIDRRRSDAVAKLTEDLREINRGFLQRTGIEENFNPFESARWAPDEKALAALEQEVKDGMAGTSLPSAVKDFVADRGYNRARPYAQELAQFIETSSLQQLMQATKGVGRALRNSDYVSPDAKAALLSEVMNSWTRICQILAVLSPVLADRRSATFEDIWFVLDRGFDQETHSQRWEALMNAICNNVVSWFQEDLFSKKMGPLFVNHMRANQGTLSAFLLLLVMIRQKPSGWEKEVERFIVSENKNSFYLNRTFSALRSEFRLAFTTERNRQELRRLAAMAIAKHQTGAKHPNLKLVKKATEAIDSADVKRANEGGAKNG
ncbi:MAG: hypothetical protein RLZZ179_3237 [Verrucomicrobiota bacterium]|jgi:hypothetical protein